MKIIECYLQELVHEGIVYSKEKLKELQKKKYISNGHYWIYVGGKNYAEMPLHAYIWNLNHPNQKIRPGDSHLIHHKNGNKLDNRPSNLVRLKKGDHDRNHMLDKRKKYADKFSKETSARGGRNSIKKHPELMKNLKYNK